MNQKMEIKFFLFFFNKANPLNIKKMYVMAALEVDLYKKRMLDATMTG